MTRFLPLLLALPGFAATITYDAANPGTFDGTPTAANTSPTSWNSTVFLPLFDAATFGNLTRVTLALTGGVFGSVRLESLDASAATISYSLSAQVSATGLNGLNVVVLPAASGSFSASAFDGGTDFGGTSGVTLLNQANTASNSTFSTAPLSLAAYSGIGTFGVALAATGNSSANGSGNLVTQFLSNAGGLVSVTYEYDPISATPEPATFAFVGLGLVAAGLIRRK